MPTTRSTARADALTAEQQLRTFIGKFTPAHQALIRAARRKLRRRLPTANELVYDNYNFFVLGYTATERSSDTIVSIVAAANGVGLSFYYGATLPDPEKLLLGSGAQNRFIRLPSADVLDRPPVKALILAAVAKARVPLAAERRGTLIIRSVAAKQRPRRRPPRRRG